MIEVKQYHLPATPLIPNSPRPLLHYRNVFLPTPTSTAIPTTSNSPSPPDPHLNPDLKLAAYDLFTKNNWTVQWIVRYGATQRAHYHTTAHEAMAVLSGTATIRFGVADTTLDLVSNTHGAGREEGGVEIRAEPGDVFILPAGVAHKTYDVEPRAEFEVLTPGEARGFYADENGDGEREGRKVVEGIEVTGFTMLGAYPVGSKWDWAFGGDSEGGYEDVWGLEKPETDPVMGKGEEGLVGLWE